MTPRRIATDLSGEQSWAIADCTYDWETWMGPDVVFVRYADDLVAGLQN